jgi:hypothetical protein
VDNQGYDHPEDQPRVSPWVRRAQSATLYAVDKTGALKVKAEHWTDERDIWTDSQDRAYQPVRDAQAQRTY